MDLAYLEAHPEHLPTFLTHQRIRETPVAGGSVCTAQRLTLDDGVSIFAKSRAGAPVTFFAAEAAGLRWLADAGGPPVPRIIAALSGMLALQWIDEGPATADGAARLGRALAAMHRAGAAAFGAGWPGFIGTLELDNTPSGGPWPGWFAEHRLLPYLRMSADRGALSGDDVALVERVVSHIEGYGGAEPPARIHGDLWLGNVLWSAGDGAYLVDPAAHGGHRETDLASLALWGGVPHLARLIAAYDEAWPLADGWRARVPLHQLHLLLVHTAMFGGSGRGAVLDALRTLGA